MDKKKGRVIDLDNYEPAKEPFLKTRPEVETGLCGLADLDEGQKDDSYKK